MRPACAYLATKMSTRPCTQSLNSAVRAAGNPAARTGWPKADADPKEKGERERGDQVLVKGLGSIQMENPHDTDDHRSQIGRAHV